MDECTADFLVRLDQDTRRGDLEKDDRTLSRLLGRPTTSFTEGLRADLEVTASASAA